MSLCICSFRPDSENIFSNNSTNNKDLEPLAKDALELVLTYMEQKQQQRNESESVDDDSTLATNLSPGSSLSTSFRSDPLLYSRMFMETFQCQISKELMKDPVLMHTTGHTVDREALCQRLLRFPDVDPITGERVEEMILYTPSIAVRQLMMLVLGGDFYQPFDDDAFLDEYRKKWAVRVATREARNFDDGYYQCATIKTEEEEESVPKYIRLENSQLYEDIEALMYGMNKKNVNIKEAFRLMEDNESGDPVLLAWRALILDPEVPTVETSQQDKEESAKKLWKQVSVPNLRAREEESIVCTLLALMYSFGVGNVTHDLVKALEYFERAAAFEENYEVLHIQELITNENCQEGNVTIGRTLAQINLGRMYRDGVVVAESAALAIDYYRKAADQGNTTAQFILGLKHFYGRGVEQSDAKALEYFQKAADQGDSTAQFKIGFMYLDGIGVEQSDAKALEYFQKAADQRDSMSQGMLGFMYQYGRGVEQNDAKAVEFYRKAADQNNADAQLRLGRMYLYGRAVEQSDAKASGKPLHQVEAICQPAPHTLLHARLPSHTPRLTQESTPSFVSRLASQGSTEIASLSPKRMHLPTLLECATFPVRWKPGPPREFRDRVALRTLIAAVPRVYA